MSKVTRTGTKVKISKKEAKATLKGFTTLFDVATIHTDRCLSGTKFSDISNLQKIIMSWNDLTNVFDDDVDYNEVLNHCAMGGYRYLSQRMFDDYHHMGIPKKDADNITLLGTLLTRLLFQAGREYQKSEKRRGSSS